MATQTRTFLVLAAGAVSASVSYSDVAPFAIASVTSTNTTGQPAPLTVDGHDLTIPAGTRIVSVAALGFHMVQRTRPAPDGRVLLCLPFAIDARYP